MTATHKPRVTKRRNKAYPVSYAINVDSVRVGTALSGGLGGPAGFSVRHQDLGVPLFNSWVSRLSFDNALRAAEAGVAHVKKVLGVSK